MGTKTKGIKKLRKNKPQVQANKQQGIRIVKKQRNHKESNHKPKPIERKQWENIIAIGALCFVFIAVYLYIFDAKLDIGGDNYNYLNYADAILKGKGYAAPYTSAYKPTNWYPPGYSSLMALVMGIFGKNTNLLKAINGMFLLGSILLLQRGFSKQAPYSFFAFSVSAWLIFNHGLLKFSTILMAEMPFLFFSVLAFYALTKITPTTKFWKSKYCYMMILASVTAYYFRSVGVVLILSILGYWLLKKQWKIAFFYLGATTMLYAPWVIRNAIHGIKGRYLGTIMAINPWQPEKGEISTLTGFLYKMGVNLYDTVIVGFPKALFPLYNINESNTFLVYLTGIIVLLVVLYGAYHTKPYHAFLLLYIMGNIGILLIWHSGNGVRYIWPLVPFIAYCFMNGVVKYSSQLLALKKNINIPKFASLGVLALCFFVNHSGLKALNHEANKAMPPAYRNYIAIAQQFKGTNKEGHKVVCRKPGIFYFHSGAYVSRYKYDTDSRQVIKAFVENEVDYVVVASLGYSSTGRYLVPAINQNQGLFKLVMKLDNPDTYLLAFDAQKAKRRLKVQSK